MPTCDYHWHEDTIKDLRAHNEKLRAALGELVKILTQTGVSFPAAWELLAAKDLLDEDPP